jgi:hypothetical protein
VPNSINGFTFFATIAVGPILSAIIFQDTKSLLIAAKWLRVKYVS